MSISITVDRDSKEPLYRQIAGQIRAQIRSGSLPIGTKLPTIRHLAKTLGVTRLTVENAYDDLRANGWVETIVGSGTFVAHSAQPRVENIGRQATPRGVLGDIPSIHEINVVRSFAYAEPDAERLPVAQFWDSLSILRDSTDMMRYRSPQGEAALRVELASLLRERGVEVTPGNLIITAGVTQGLSMTVQALTQPGDFVAVEEQSHLTMLHTLTMHGVNIVGVTRDDEGPRPDALERVIVQQRPRFFYLIPTGQNPTGQTITARRRRELLDMAQKYGLMLIEDDIYGLLNYLGDPQPALKALDETEHVIYLSGFSKVLMPGLRIGYMAAPEPLHQRLLALKQAIDLYNPPFVQQALANFIRSGKFRDHRRAMLPVYRARRECLLRELRQQMPPGVTWLEPQGGLVCWLTLPAGVDANAVYRAALQQGFAFTPGNAFLAQSSDTSHLRICFGAQPEQYIREAVAALSAIIRDALRNPVQYPDTPF
jgi:DNA-binding transcriptional MocR family regulator